MVFVTFRKVISGVVDVYLSNEKTPIGRITINYKNRRWDLWLKNECVLRNATTLVQAKELMQAILIAAGKADNLSDEIPSVKIQSRSLYGRNDEQ